MTPPVKVCTKCFKPMAPGARVQEILRWEDGKADASSTRTRFICRECAAKEARRLRVEVPRGARP